MRLTVAPDAATGFRDVTVSTDRGDGSIETANGHRAPSRWSAPPRRSDGAVGHAVARSRSARRADVKISGGAHALRRGAASPAFGAGVTVNRADRDSPTSAVANVTVAAGRGDRLPRRDGADRRRARARERAGAVPRRRRAAAGRAADEREPRARASAGRPSTSRSPAPTRRSRPGRRWPRSAGPACRCSRPTVSSPTVGSSRGCDRRRRAARLPRPQGHDRRASTPRCSTASRSGRSPGAGPVRWRVQRRAGHVRRPLAAARHAPQRQRGVGAARAQAAPARQRQRHRLRGRDLGGGEGRARRGGDLPPGREEGSAASWRRGGLAGPRRCAKPVWLKAKGTTSWSLRLEAPAPARDLHAAGARPRRGGQPPGQSRDPDAAGELRS